MARQADPKPACDCLNHCGDDPWLDDRGRAERDRAIPCPSLVAYRERTRRAVQAFELLATLEGDDMLDKLTRLKARAEAAPQEQSR